MAIVKSKAKAPVAPPPPTYPELGLGVPYRVLEGTEEIEGKMVDEILLTWDSVVEAAKNLCMEDLLSLLMYEREHKNRPSTKTRLYGSFNDRRTKIQRELLCG